MGDEYDQFQHDVLEAVHQTGAGTSQVVPNQDQLSSEAVVMDEDDVALIDKAPERLAGPQRVKVSMDDL